MNHTLEHLIYYHVRHPTHCTFTAKTNFSMDQGVPAGFVSSEVYTELEEHRHMSLRPLHKL